MRLFFRLLIAGCCLAAASFAASPAVPAKAGKPGRMVSAPVAAAAPGSFLNALERGADNGAYDRVVVGLIEGKNEKTWSFGKDKDKAFALKQFEIGAASDVFTSLLLAQAVLEGKVRLAQPISKWLPADFVLAEPKLAEVTLEALATHRSGLPATPANFFPANVADPYADYSTSAMLAFLANYHPHELTSNYRYSSLNAALLGYLLGRVYADEFPALLHRKVLVPLGLPLTDFVDSDRLLTGAAAGQATDHWHYDALAPAAGLRSSLSELLAFMRANLTPDSSPLRAAVLLARQARAPSDTGEVGLGWNIREVSMGNQTWPLVWRASQTGGFSTFIGFRTDQQKALVILANSSTPLAALGVGWLTDDAPPNAAQKPYRPDAAHLAQYPGLYQMLSGPEITVRTTNGILTAQLQGSPALPMVGYADDAFGVSGGGLDLSFSRNVDQITGLLLHTGGQYIVAKRLSNAAPQLERPPMPITAGALREYGGDYELTAESQLRVAPQPDSLTVQLTGAERVAMRAYAADRFAAIDGVDTLTFKRDANAKIVGCSIELAGGQHEATLIHWKVP